MPAATQDARRAFWQFYAYTTDGTRSMHPQHSTRHQQCGLQTASGLRENLNQYITSEDTSVMVQIAPFHPISGQGDTFGAGGGHALA